MLISDWSSDVCSSDLDQRQDRHVRFRSPVRRSARPRARTLQFFPPRFGIIDFRSLNLPISEVAPVLGLPLAFVSPASSAPSLAFIRRSASVTIGAIVLLPLPASANGLPSFADCAAIF